MHEHVIHEKKAAKDYDGDGKIESGKDEYFGSRDKAIKKAMGKKVKKESLSDWRTDLNDLIEIVDEPQSREQKEVVEKKVKNKVIINPKFTEAVEEMGGELLEMTEVIEESEEDAQEGTSYGLYKGSGKPSGAMKDYLDKKAKKLEAEKKKQKPEYKNNPAFGDPSHHSNKSNKSESREYSHNPEKYHDSEGHDKKLERDKPYRKRSRAARMADPDRGINSPAFKKFMADRGM